MRAILARIIILGLVVPVLGATPAGADWKIPDPHKMEHPGAAEAPASDPRTYPDADGFKKRAGIILEGLATNELDKWRRGYFTGGDPGKYLPGAAMAKLLLNPDDAEARKYMNDDRSPREHYHFAAVNWGRFLPLFGEALTAPTRQRLAEHAANYSPYLSPTGTENHKLMWMTTANVLPHYLDHPRFAKTDRAAALDRARAALRSYVKSLYQAGQGEWDSSTYLMFDVNGMLNIYDFSPDPEARLLAKAALDWYMTGYALKYTDGVFCAPNQRGFAGGPVQTIGDQTGWLWWGSRAEISPARTGNFLYTVHAITSGWRPNRVIHNIATRNLPQLPFEARNTKANYWYGHGVAAKPGQYHETVYLHPDFTVGTLWNGHGSQMTRFQVVAAGDNGGVVLTGGNPRQSDHTGKKTGLGFQDGNGRYTQFAAAGPAVISMSWTPDDDAQAAWSFVTVPQGVEPQQTTTGWWTMRVGRAVVAVRPLGGAAGLFTSEPDRRGRTTTMLKIPGHKSGFIIETLPADAANKLASAKVDDSKFASQMRVAYTTTEGRTITMTFQPAAGDDDRHGNRHADVAIDGRSVDFAAWPVYHSPYIQADKGVLTVNDGRDGFTVDFTGQSPVYKPWKKD
jgi:hypothetical protein